jgi:MFS family permease
MYSHSIGLSSSTGAGLVAGFNFSSAIGRILAGFCCDYLGPLNTLFLALSLSATSMLALWPVSRTLGPMVAFVIINGASNGGFFATMPTVIGNVFGSARLSVAMGMIVTGWGGGYLMVSYVNQPFLQFSNALERVLPLQAIYLKRTVARNKDFMLTGLPFSMLVQWH